MHAPDRVHTVDDYYDGPRGGVADFRGEPHQYRSIYLDGPSWHPDEDRFHLTPISRTVRDLAIERFRLWQRWQTASLQGTVGELAPDAPRILKEDLAAFVTIEAAIAAEYAHPTGPVLLVRGSFSQSGVDEGPLGGLTVYWEVVEVASAAGK